MAVFNNFRVMYCEEQNMLTCRVAIQEEISCKDWQDTILFATIRQGQDKKAEQLLHNVGYSEGGTRGYVRWLAQTCDVDITRLLIDSLNYSWKLSIVKQTGF